MSDETKLNPRAQGEAFLAHWDEMVTRERLLETENKAMAEQVEALIAEVDRLREREQILIAQRDTAFHADTASKNLLDDIGRRLLAGMKVIRPTTLRGVPQRPNDTNEQMPRVVRMGPQGA